MLDSGVGYRQWPGPWAIWFRRYVFQPPSATLFDRRSHLADFTRFAAAATGPVATPIDTPFGFTGQGIDRLAGGQLVLYDYKGREYNPRLGRFIQRDPSGPADSYNLYEYVRSRPTIARDPTGKLLDLLLGSSLSMRLRATVGGLGAGALASARALVDKINVNSILLDGALRNEARLGPGFLGRALDLLSNKLPGAVRGLNPANFAREYARLVYGSPDALKGTGYQVHHLFQKGGQLGEWFLERGLNPNIPFFGVQLTPEEHRAIQPIWDKAMNALMASDRYASATDIVQRARQIAATIPELAKKILF